MSAVKENKCTNDTIAVVLSDNNRTISTDNLIVKVISVNGRKSTVLSLLDMGSPISFICSKAFYKFFDPDIPLNSSEKTYKAVNGKPIEIMGTVSTSIILESLPMINAEILFHILKDDILACQIIFDRDFFINNKISCLFSYSKEKKKERLKFFAQVALADILDNQSDDLKYLKIVQRKDRNVRVFLYYQCLNK